MNQEMENFKKQVSEIIKDAVDFVRQDEIDKIAADLQEGRNIFLRLMPICRGNHQLVSRLDQQLHELEIPHIEKAESSMEEVEEVMSVSEEEPKTVLSSFETHYGIDHTLCLKMTSDFRMQGKISEADLEMVWESGRVQEMVLGGQSLSLENQEARKQAFFEILKQYIESRANIEALGETNYVDMLTQKMNEMEEKKAKELTEEQHLTMDVLTGAYQEFQESYANLAKDNGSKDVLSDFITKLKTLESNYRHITQTYNDQELKEMFGQYNLSLDEVKEQLDLGRTATIQRLQISYEYLGNDFYHFDALVKKGQGLIVFNYNCEYIEEIYQFLTTFYDEEELHAMITQNSSLMLNNIKYDLEAAHSIMDFYQEMNDVNEMNMVEIVALVEVLKTRDDLNEQNKASLPKLEAMLEEYRQTLDPASDFNSLVAKAKDKYQQVSSAELVKMINNKSMESIFSYFDFADNLKQHHGLEIDEESDNLLMDVSLQNIYNTMDKVAEQSEKMDLDNFISKEPIEDVQEKEENIVNLVQNISAVSKQKEANEQNELPKVPVSVEEDIVGTLKDTIDVIDMESPKYQEFLRSAQEKTNQLNANASRKLKIPKITQFNIFSRKRKEMKKYNASVDYYNEYQKAHALTELYGQYFDLSETDQEEVDKGKAVLEAWKHDLDEISEKYQKHLVNGNTPKIEKSEKPVQGKPIKLPQTAVNSLSKEHQKRFDGEVDSIKELLETKKDVELVKESQELNKKIQSLGKDKQELLEEKKLDTLGLVSLVAVYKAKAGEPTKEIRKISHDTRVLYEEMVKENSENDTDLDVKVIEEQIKNYQDTSLEEIEQLILEENMNLKKALSSLRKNEIDEKNATFLKEAALRTAIKKGVENEFKDFSDEDKKYIHEEKVLDSDFAKFVNKYAENQLDVYVDQEGNSIFETPIKTEIVEDNNKELEEKLLDFPEVERMRNAVLKSVKKQNKTEKVKQEEDLRLKAIADAVGVNIEGMNPEQVSQALEQMRTLFQNLNKVNEEVEKGHAK